MAKGTRICKVCGKEYEYCKTWLSDYKFRWQDVACSPECGSIYFARVEASRSGEAVTDEAAEPIKSVKKSSKKSAKKQVEETPIVEEAIDAIVDLVETDEAEN